MYYLLHRNQLHVSALFIGHLQVHNGKLNKQLHSIWIDMYYLLHRNQPHVSALFIGHLQVDNGKLNKQLHSIWNRYVLFITLKSTTCFGTNSCVRH